MSRKKTKNQKLPRSTKVACCGSGFLSSCSATEFQTAASCPRPMTEVSARSRSLRTPGKFLRWRWTVSATERAACLQTWRQHRGRRGGGSPWQLGGAVWGAEGVPENQPPTHTRTLVLMGELTHLTPSSSSVHTLISVYFYDVLAKR